MDHRAGGSRPWSRGSWRGWCRRRGGRQDSSSRCPCRCRGRSSRGLDHGDGDAAALRIARRRGRDRIIARRQQRQHFQIGMERQLAGRMLFQQVEHRFAFCQHLGAVAFGGCGVIADKGQQFRLGHRAARLLRHDLDLLAGRDLLQLDELGEQPPDRDRLADRQLRAAAFTRRSAGSDRPAGSRSAAPRNPPAPDRCAAPR